jgi:hypothetical protein
MYLITSRWSNDVILNIVSLMQQPQPGVDALTATIFHDKHEYREKKNN